MTNHDALLTALERVAGKPVTPIRDQAGQIDFIGTAQAHGLRARPVVLKGTWWRGADESLIAFHGAGAVPVALLPDHNGGLRAYHADNPKPFNVDAAFARDMLPDAFAFSMTFPARPVALRDILMLIWSVARRDLLRLLVIGVGAGALSMAIPLVSAYVFDVIIPYHAQSQLVVAFILLAVAALSLAVFELARGWLTTRINARLDHHLQAAVWDKVLNAPVTQLRTFQTADLAERALGIKALKPFSALLLTSALAGLFIAANVLLLVTLSVRMTLLAISLITVSLVVNVTLGAAQQHKLHEALAMQGRLSSFAYQMLESIAKLQIARAAGRALRQFRGHLVAQRTPQLEAQHYQTALITFNGGFPVFAAVVIFVATARFSGLDVAAFLVFNVAFTQIMTTMLGWSGALIGALGSMPYYARLKPLLSAPPEVTSERDAPPRLSGRVSFKNVFFHYQPHEKWLLNNLSLHIQPGEWVAITGRVGSGKSTLLRLLLGFETPNQGDVYFDGLPLSSLNPQLVRAQMGVVLQNAQLLAGTIRQAITQPYNVSDEEIWRAAEIACIADTIRQMPMGLNTFLSEGAHNVSGGQGQRLLLARALIGRPALLLLDEATSALDDATQERVMKNLRALNLTCIMIAHRPETLAYCDHVFTLRQGELLPVAGIERSV